MRFVVTGGAGFIGSHIVKLLLEKKYEVIVIDNLHTGRKQNIQSVIDQIDFHEADIREYEKISKIIENSDGIFHQAALTSVPESYEIPKVYDDVNVRGTENIFQLAHKYDFKVVYASSSSVYGHQNKMPIMENTDRNPINPYGKTKLDDEYLFEKYSKMGTKIIGLRYFNIFGKGQTLEYAGVITKFLDRINQKEPPIIYGDGSQIRDFIFVEDIVLANLLAMQSPVSSSLVNIGTGKAITISELANMMIETSGQNLKPIFKESLEGDIKKSQADISLAINSLNWRPKKELQDWLKEIFSN